VSDRPDTGPSWGDVLLDLCTGAAAGTGDLRWTLRGSGGVDRDPAVALGPWVAMLSTGVKFVSAELSTILLRRLPPGRSARSWITSGLVSARGGVGRRLELEPFMGD